jgi:hypothetical protein
MNRRNEGEEGLGLNEIVVVKTITTGGRRAAIKKIDLSLGPKIDSPPLSEEHVQALAEEFRETPRNSYMLKRKPRRR